MMFSRIFVQKVTFCLLTYSNGFFKMKVVVNERIKNGILSKMYLTQTLLKLLKNRLNEMVKNVINWIRDCSEKMVLSKLVS